MKARRVAAARATAAAAILGGWVAIDAACTQRKTGAPASVDAGKARSDGREQVLRGPAAKFGNTTHDGFWVVLIETGTAEGAATLMALSDGSASLALDTGDWRIRDNTHPRVRAGAQRLCELALVVKDSAV